MEFLDHRVRRMNVAGDVIDCLMMGRIERLPDGRLWRDPLALQEIQHRGERHLDPLDDRFAIAALTSRLDRAFQVVDYRQQVAQQVLTLKPHRFLALLANPAAYVVSLSQRAQVLVLELGDLLVLFQHLLGQLLYLRPERFEVARRLDRVGAGRSGRSGIARSGMLGYLGLRRESDDRLGAVRILVVVSPHGRKPRPSKLKHCSHTRHAAIRFCFVQADSIRPQRRAGIRREYRSNFEGFFRACGSDTAAPPFYGISAEATRTPRRFMSKPASYDFNGKVVVITGGSRGLGHAMAMGFASAGAKVAVASRKIESCEAAVKEIRALGSDGSAHAIHVGKWADCDRLADEVYARWGRCDVLINNAGMSPLYPSLAEHTEDLFDKVIGVNLKGPFRLSALFGSRMAAADGGAIINISSIGAIRPSATTAPYSAATAGLNALPVAFP